MHSIHVRKSLFIFLFVVIAALTGFAQNSQSAANRVAAASEARQLRFTARRSVEHLRLQVHDSAGSLIHDSGLISKNNLAWALRDRKGNPLREGTYNWTLTVKESGKASPVVKHGQFNLENTSGAKTAGSSAATTVVVDGSGTAGNIPKWVTATELGDSIIIEENGNVAIGSTPGSNIRLRVYLKPEDRNAATVIQAVLQPSNEDNQQTTGSAVYALAEGPLGSNQGVWGISHSNIGVGVRGTALHEFDPENPVTKSVGVGVRGNSKSLEGIGVEGVTDSTTGRNIGVRGESLSNTGVGVLGHATANSGVNFGVVGRTESPNGFAGFFVGRVHVAGFLSKAAGAFKIDHPLDPENKYLSHSFVESPEMMNIYNGIVTLGKDGSAEVTLPDWFEALNRDFRYQLTCIGGFSPVYVAQKVSGNRFKIAGGQPGMEVSWQLTGVRHDAYAEKNRIQVEEMKPVAERGAYLHPDAFGKSNNSVTGMKQIIPTQEKAAQR